MASEKIPLRGTMKLFSEFIGKVIEAIEIEEMTEEKEAEVLEISERLADSIQKDQQDAELFRKQSDYFDKLIAEATFTHAKEMD